MADADYSRLIGADDNVISGSDGGKKKSGSTSERPKELWKGE